ncbi:hypothetical protein KKB69_03175 [Patescibacteria group bacterium]|nr:hypothetical protein [Patescibacteria group bacterium]
MKNLTIYLVLYIIKKDKNPPKADKFEKSTKIRKKEVRIMGLCTDQLAEYLVALIKNINKDTDIDEAWAKAKKRAENEAKSQSFDQQVKTLLDKGYPEAAGTGKDRFLNYINPLKEHFCPGSVIVIPENMVSLDKQMAMVELNGKTGYAYADTTEIYNAEGMETPRKPYLIHDTEDGKDTLSNSPNDCAKMFKKQNRHGLNAQEGIAVITHKPEILKDRYLNLPGSHYKSSDLVPVLFLSRSCSTLQWSSADLSIFGQGSASCGSRG